METQKINIELLKALYPKPRPWDPAGTCGYCVAGAFLAFQDGMPAFEADEGYKADRRPSYFPRGDELADLLRNVNPALPEPLATRYAHFITGLNDRKMFSFAWSTLKEALEWKEETPHNWQLVG